MLFDREISLIYNLGGKAMLGGRCALEAIRCCRRNDKFACFHNFPTMEKLQPGALMGTKIFLGQRAPGIPS